MKTAFLSPLITEDVMPWANDGTGQSELRAVFSFQTEVLKKRIDVPFGFSTDFASVPKGILMWGLFGGRYKRPATAHDYLIRFRICYREKADLVFLELMRHENQLELDWMAACGEEDDEISERKYALEGRATTMYAAVSLYTKSGLWKKDFDKPGYEPIG